MREKNRVSKKSAIPPSNAMMLEYVNELFGKMNRRERRKMKRDMAKFNLAAKNLKYVNR